MWNLLFSLKNKKIDFSQNKSKKYEESKKSYLKKITKAMLYDLLSNMSNEEESSNENRDKNDSSEEESEATLLVNSAMYKNV